MPEQINHWCKICGVGYYACDDCDKLGNWRATACSPHHAQIYSALIFYTRNQATKEQTASYLKSLDISENEIATFIPSIQILYNEIMTDDELRSVRKKKNRSTKS